MLAFQLLSASKADNVSGNEDHIPWQILQKESYGAASEKVVRLQNFPSFQNGFIMSILK